MASRQMASQTYSQASTTHDISGKPARPVLLWASFGAVVAYVVVSSLVQWMLSGDFKPSPVGTDPVPAITLIMVRTLEVGGVLAALVLIWHFVIQPIRQAGEISWDGMFLIICFLLWFTDPMDNYFNFAFSYNAHAFNMGSWSMFIPGWEAPLMGQFPEPLFMMGGMYIWFVFGFSVLGCRIIGKSKQLFPNGSILTHLFVVFVCFFLLDLVIEAVCVRHGVFVYGGTYHKLTLWAGEPYQFPLYESTFIGLLCTTLTSLRYFRDDKGYSFAEKGLQHIKLAKPAKKLLSFLSLLGISFLIIFVTFYVPFNWFTLKADSFPKQPSYLRYEICGQGTNYACPSREVPIPSRSSIAVGPNDPRLSSEARQN